MASSGPAPPGEHAVDDIPRPHDLNRNLSNRNRAIRQVSGLDRSTRLRLHVACDDDLAEIRNIDDQLAELSYARRSLVGQLAERRDQLWPVVPWKKGRRPPDFDQDALPPVVAEPT